MIIADISLYPVYPRLLFLGVLLSMAVYVFGRYLAQRDKAALFYTVYTCLLCLYFTFRLTKFPGFSFLVFKYEPGNAFFHSNLLNLVFILYFFFASSFLDAAKRYPRLDRFIMAVTKINLGLWCIGTLLLFIFPGSPAFGILNYIESILIILMAVMGTVAVARYWSYLERAFVAGASALIISGLYTLCLHLVHGPNGSRLRLPGSEEILMVCIIIEQFTYAVAIGYKARKERNKITALEKYWIRELEANKQLQDKLHASMLEYQEQLEKEVRERTDEVIRRNNELQEEKLQKALEEYRRAALESELKALRTQINPHFLFNCMNILSSFVIRDLKEDALDFILKFSRLMRLVLENSTHHEVTIEKDIEALKLYVHLEAIRYGHSFQYEFDVAEQLLKEDYHIPPLLLQPYVENAIRHGLGNKESGERLLKISLRLEDRHIVCEISDNGIGREKAGILKPRSTAGPHRSMGMKVTESRINLLKELSYGKASVNITDLKGDQTGTVIRLILPVK